MSETKKEVKEVKAIVIDTGVVEEPQILPHDPKFMTPERQIMLGNPNSLDPHLYQITLVKWADFIRFLEPIRRNIVGSKHPSPNLPVFYKVYELSNRVNITFMALGGFRIKTMLSYSFSEKMKAQLNTIEALSPKFQFNKDKINRKIQILEKMGYIVVAGEIDPWI